MRIPRNNYLTFTCSNGHTVDVNVYKMENGKWSCSASVDGSIPKSDDSWNLKKDVAIALDDMKRIGFKFNDFLWTWTLDC